MRTKTRSEKFHGTSRGYHTDFTEDKEHGRQNWLHNLQVPVQENAGLCVKKLQFQDGDTRPGEAWDTPTQAVLCVPDGMMGSARGKLEFWVIEEKRELRRFSSLLA